MHHPTKGKCAHRGCFLALRPMERFRSTAIFSPRVSVQFRFAALPLGFPSLFPLGRLVSSSCFFWGALALLLCALARLVFLLRFFLFLSALFGCRQSLVFRSSKKCFCAPSLSCARHAPARPVFRIIAFTSSPNAHNLLIWSVLR